MYPPRPSLRYNQAGGDHPGLLSHTQFIIPFICSNAVSGIIAYVAMSMGLVAVPAGLIQLPWTMPVIRSGFIVTQSVSGAVLQIVQLVVATLF